MLNIFLEHVFIFMYLYFIYFTLYFEIVKSFLNVFFIL